MNVDKFLAYLTPDVKWHFANSDVIIGHDAVKESLLGFWATMDSVTHHIVKSFEVDDTVIVQFDMEYRRKDGTSVHIPCCDILIFNGDLVCDFRIYIDLAPLYA